MRVGIKLAAGVIRSNRCKLALVSATTVESVKQVVAGVIRSNRCKVALVSVTAVESVKKVVAG